MTGSVEARTITIEEGALTLTGASTPVLTLGSGGFNLTSTAAGAIMRVQLNFTDSLASQTWQNNNATGANSFVTNASTNNPRRCEHWCNYVNVGWHPHDCGWRDD